MRRLLGIRNVRIFVGAWTKDLTGSNSAAGEPLAAEENPVFA
jgi:hypothetical protein